ncbi:uncharacterized protein LOC128246654 isoform X2 [Mya arenaria]|uniref:uncharacterized protein LOC128246654 isoform X2 n=1 Tax=Mya arenaria TaxID=6604 RepID=UPI0022E8C680|nr:uncharacterized protein LOC128246654 isoform X2 [Mya arenaria]
MSSGQGRPPGGQGKQYRGSGPKRGGNQGNRENTDRVGHNQSQRGGHNQSQRGGNNQSQRGGYNQPQRGGYNQPQRGGYDQPQRGGYDQPQRGGNNPPQRGGYDQPQRGGYDQPQRGGYNQSQRGGYDQPQRGGNNQSQRGGYNQPQRGGNNQSQRGGYNQPQRGGNNQSQREGYDQLQRGGKNQPQRGGYDQPQRGENNQSHRGGFHQPQRGGQNQFGRGSHNPPQRGDYSQNQRGGHNHPESGGHNQQERWDNQGMEQFPPTPGQNYNDGCGCPLPPNQHGVGSYGQQFNQPGQGILATPPMQYGTVPMIPLMSMNLNMPYSQPCPPFPYSSNTPPHNSPEYHQQQQPRNRPPGSRQGPRNQGNQGLSRASSTMSVDSIHSDTSDGRRQGKKFEKRGNQNLTANNQGPVARNRYSSCEHLSEPSSFSNVSGLSNEDYGARPKEGNQQRNCNDRVNKKYFENDSNVRNNRRPDLPFRGQFRGRGRGPSLNRGGRSRSWSHMAGRGGRNMNVDIGQNTDDSDKDSYISEAPTNVDGNDFSDEMNKGIEIITRRGRGRIYLRGYRGRGRPFRGRGGPYGKQSRQRKEYEDGESDGEMEAVAVDNATDINVDEAKETTTKARRQNKRNRKRRVKGQVRRGGQTNNTTDEHIDEASSGTEDEVMLVNENTGNDICSSENILKETSSSGFKVDDIETVKLLTLKNRLSRYKKNLNALMDKVGNSDEVKIKQEQLDAIKTVIERRRETETKDEEIKQDLGEEGLTEEETETEDETDDEEGEKEPSKACFQRSSRAYRSAKVFISFKPRASKKTGKFRKNESPVSEKTVDGKTSKNNKAKEEFGLNIPEKKASVLTDLLSKLDKLIVSGTAKEQNVPIQAKQEDVSPNVASGTNEPKKPDNKRVKHHSGGNPLANDVFKYMVRTFEGQGEPNDIHRESGMFPVDCNIEQWFRAMKTRFSVFEKDGKVIHVAVYMKDISYCLDYIKATGCSKECTRYHVCKDMLCNNCKFGAGKCKFSHDFLDKRNMATTKKLGMNDVFSNDEICSILKVRYPHACEYWIANDGTCEDSICIGLHLCDRFIFGKCLREDSCALGHDFTTEHNREIMKAFKMENWNSPFMRKMIYLKRTPNTSERMDEPSFERNLDFEEEIVELEYIESVVDENAVVEEEIDNKAGHEDTEEVRAGRKRNPRQRGRARKTSSNKDYDSVQTDMAGETFLCEKHLMDSCKRSGCKFHHTQSKSTYIWQVKMWGEWREILNQEGAEQLYCKPGCNHSESFEDIDSHLTHCQLEFKPILQAIISSEIVELSEVEARRLSTRSYSQVKHRETGFATQWRWYWKDNSGTWMLFDSDQMQRTLEAKFLVHQETYHYHRENYKWKYLIDFNAMIQTNIDTGAIREIRRRPLFVSQADVVQRNYPAGLSASPEIPAILPPDWTPWDLANQFELVKLAPTDPAYIQVANNFHQTMSRVDKQIQDIFRMQNPTLWLRFCNQEKTMLANQRRCGDESPVKKLLLFHGTDSLDAVRGISVNNFDPRVSGKNATVYGEGAYFARDAKYSHRYTKGSGLMFQAVVLVGYSTNGKKDYRRPPEKPGQTHELYDSCVNDINDPSIYILFEKNQYYPEYLIQYVDLYRAPSPPPVRPVTRPRHSIPGVNTGTTGAVFTCSAGSIAPYGSSSTGATGMYGTTSSSSTSHIPGSTSPTSPSGSYSTGAYTGGTGNASTAASGSTSPVGGSGYRAGSSSGSRSTATTSGSTGTYARASANSAFLNVNVSPPKPDKSCAIQ